MNSIYIWKARSSTLRNLKVKPNMAALEDCLGTKPDLWRHCQKTDDFKKTVCKIVLVRRNPHEEVILDISNNKGAYAYSLLADKWKNRPFDLYWNSSRYTCQKISVARGYMTRNAWDRKLHTKCCELHIYVYLIYDKIERTWYNNLTSKYAVTLLDDLGV